MTDEKVRCRCTAQGGGVYDAECPLHAGEQERLAAEQRTEKGSTPESHWNYRVTRSKVDGEYVFEVREVYYGHGQPHSWSADPIAPHGESWHELADDLVKMQRAVSEPVLDLTGDKPREMSGAERARSRVTSPGKGGTTS